MKPILIDEFIKSAGDTTAAVSVVINGHKLTGWQIAKPENYEKEYTPFWERLQGALLVLKGKAVPVQYFCDLTEAQQITHVKSVLQGQGVIEVKD